MITRDELPRLHELPRLLVTAAFTGALLFCATNAHAQRTGTKPTHRRQAAVPFANDRIDISHARSAAVTHQRQRQQPAKLRQQPQNQRPKQRLNPVQQASYAGGSCVDCGPICDCADVSCGVEYMEPTCGCGAMGECGCGLEPACGMEMMEPTCGCAMGECSCGVEYIEPSCGCAGECSCGVEYIEPTCGCDLGGFCGCGVEVLPSCGCEGECSCGVEFIGPTCGMEPDCGCDSCCTTSACLPSGMSVFLPYLSIDWRRFELFAGVNGFMGPMNCVATDANNPNNLRSAGGSFGFYEGFNEGRDLKRLLGFDIASQFGLRATQTHISGSKITDDTRQQVFVTGALFRRVDYGIQYGVAIDYLNDDWYFQGDLVQIRSEISFNTAKGHVFGVEIMSGTGSDTSVTDLVDDAGNQFSTTVQYEPLDQYRAFYRAILPCGGDWDAFVGGTGEQDIVLGARVNMPLYDNVVFNGGVTYVSPDDEGVAFAHHDEAWNLSMGFTYRPGGARGCGRYCRPMFSVADNGTFIVRRR